MQTSRPRPPDNCPAKSGQVHIAERACQDFVANRDSPVSVANSNAVVNIIGRVMDLGGSRDQDGRWLLPNRRGASTGQHGGGRMQEMATIHGNPP